MVKTSTEFETKHKYRISDISQRYDQKRKGFRPAPWLQQHLRLGAPGTECWLYLLLVYSFLICPVLVVFSIWACMHPRYPLTYLVCVALYHVGVAAVYWRWLAGVPRRPSVFMRRWVQESVYAMPSTAFFKYPLMRKFLKHVWIFYLTMSTLEDFNIKHLLKNSCSSRTTQNNDAVNFQS